MKKLYIIVYILLLAVLISCSNKEDEVEKLNATEITNMYDTCILDKGILQTKYDTQNVTLKNLKQEHLKLKNITLVTYPQNISDRNELIRRNKYLQNLSDSCHFYNATEREEQLKEELEEYEDDIKDLEDDLDECEAKLDICENNLSNC